ncbi:MAG: hypothetical protein PUC32_01820 [Oscillospiraceae bacterium]|nr:hypothetical protein [Oscillospiraceae bacterium]
MKGSKKVLSVGMGVILAASITSVLAGCGETAAPAATQSASTDQSAT